MYELTWFMLHTVTAGKYTSDRGTVVECIVVTTVLFRKFSAALYIKRKATAIPAKTIIVHTIRQAKLF